MSADFSQARFVSIFLQADTPTSWKGNVIAHTTNSLITLPMDPTSLLDIDINNISYIYAQWNGPSGYYTLAYQSTIGFFFFTTGGNQLSWTINPGRTVPLYINVINNTANRVNLVYDAIPAPMLHEPIAFNLILDNKFMENKTIQHLPIKAAESKELIVGAGTFTIPYNFGIAEIDTTQVNVVISNETDTSTTGQVTVTQTTIDQSADTKTYAYVSSADYLYDVGLGYAAYQNLSISPVATNLINNTKIIVVEGEQTVLLIQPVTVESTTNFTTITLKLVISLVPAPVINTQIVTPASYYGIPDGSISLTLTFAHPATLTYTGNNITNTINYPNADPMQPFSMGTEIININNLLNGTYTFTLNSYLNTETFTIVVGSPGQLAATVQLPPNNMLGEVDIIVTGGVGPYTYQWFYEARHRYKNCSCNNYKLISDAVSEKYTITQFVYGKHKVLVTDSFGLTVTVKFNIPPPVDCIVKGNNKYLEVRIIGHNNHSSRFAYAWYSVNDTNKIKSRSYKLWAKKGAYIVFVLDKTTGQGTSAIAHIY